MVLMSCVLLYKQIFMIMVRKKEDETDQCNDDHSSKVWMTEVRMTILESGWNLYGCG